MEFRSDGVYPRFGVCESKVCARLFAESDSLFMAKALGADAPILHADRFPDGFPEEPTNLAAHISLEVGEPDAAFERADVVIEQTYSVPMCHQGYIEPHACVARVDAAQLQAAHSPRTLGAAAR